MPHVIHHAIYYAFNILTSRGWQVFAYYSVSIYDWESFSRYEIVWCLFLKIFWMPVISWLMCIMRVIMLSVWEVLLWCLCGTLTTAPCVCLSGPLGLILLRRHLFLLFGSLCLVYLCICLSMMPFIVLLRLLVTLFRLSMLLLLGSVYHLLRCVELDFLESHPDEIMIVFGDDVLTQRVIYDKLRLYCSDCKHVSHYMSTCYAFGYHPRPEHVYVHASGSRVCFWFSCWWFFYF